MLDFQQLRALFLLSLLASGAALPARAGVEDVTLGNCPPPTNFEEVSAWVKAIDRRSDLALREAGKGDRRMVTGSVIAKACFAGKDAVKQAKLEKIMQKALARVATQAARCYRRFGFRELTSLVPVLRRTRFECIKQEGNAIASAPTTKIDGHIFRKCEVASRFDHQYQVSLDPDTVLKSEANPEEFASTLFHELLHHLPTFNRSWHNGWSDLGHTTTGCGNSVFEDRVYMYEAACFPKGDLGLTFYGLNPSMPECAKNNVCRAALAGADKETLATYNHVYGKQHLVAKAYREPDAERVCTALRDTNRRQKWLSAQRIGLSSRAWKLNKFIKSNLPTDERKQLEADITSLLSIADAQLEMPAGKPAALQKMRGLREAIETGIKAHCQPEPQTHWRKVCERYPASIATELKFAVQLVEKLRTEDVEVQQFFQ